MWSARLLDRLRRRPDDQGFGLVEVLVSITVFAIIATGILPLLLSGIRASLVAEQNTQARALGQERLEVIRNMPFFVGSGNSSGAAQDVLDSYFRDTVPVGAIGVDDVCSNRTYVPPTYTCEIDRDAAFGADYGTFRQFVDAQFLNEVDGVRTVVTPPPTYDSQNDEFDQPASNLLSVVVRTTWQQYGTQAEAVIRTEVANALPGVERVTADVSTSAVRIIGELANTDKLQFEAGLLSADGTQTTGSSASLSAVGAFASLSSGATAQGAALSLTAPPLSTGSAGLTMAAKLDAACEQLCFDQSAISGTQRVDVETGLPDVSDVATPVSSALQRTTESGTGFTYSHAPAALRRDELALVAPLVTAGTGPVGDVVRSSGYLDATGSGASAVVAKAATSAEVVQVLPTSFAPEGVVQLVLSDLQVDCRSGAGGGSAVATWNGSVRYWSGSAYVPLPVGNGTAALPPPGSLVVGVEPDPLAPGMNRDVTLDRWITSWSGLNDTAAVAAIDGERSSIEVPSVMTVVTAPVRDDDRSSLTVAVGAASCSAEDLR